MISQLSKACSATEHAAGGATGDRGLVTTAGSSDHAQLARRLIFPKGRETRALLSGRRGSASKHSPRWAGYVSMMPEHV